MATVPEGYAQPEPEAVGPRFDLYAWVTTTDYKRIGILCLLTAGLFLVVRGASRR